MKEGSIHTVGRDVVSHFWSVVLEKGIGHGGCSNDVLTPTCRLPVRP